MVLEALLDKLVGKDPHACVVSLLLHVNTQLRARCRNWQGVQMVHVTAGDRSPEHLTSVVSHHLKIAFSLRLSPQTVCSAITPLHKKE